MSTSQQPTPQPIDQAMAEAMGAHLYGDASPEQRRRLSVALERSPSLRSHWEDLSVFFDALAGIPLPQAPSHFEERMLERLTEATESAERLGTLELVHGEVHRAPSESESWSPVQAHVPVRAGDRLRVGKGSRALLRLADRSELWINAESLLHLSARKAAHSVRLVRGEILALMEKQRRSFEVLTADGVVEVMGTVFNTHTAPDRGTRVSVLSGRVRVRAGQQGREVKAGRRVRFVNRRGVGRVQRMSVGEARRIEKWAKPVRRASRASGKQTLETVRKETAMNAIMKSAGLLAIVGLALWFTYPWSLWGSPGVAGSIEDARALIADAKRVESPASPRQSLVPRPGDVWRQTALFRGQVLERDFFNADRLTPGEMRFVTDIEARATADPNHIILSHQAVEVTGRDDLSRVHPNLREQLRQEARQREAVLERSSFTQVLDGLGRQVGIEPNLDFGSNHSEIVIDPFLLVLLNTPAGFPEGALEEGTSWSWEQPLVFHPDLTITITSTLDHFEEIDGDQVAVIQSEAECHTAERKMLVEERRPDLQDTLRAFRERLDLTWSQEARHRLRDGRRLVSTGQFSLDTLFTVTAQPDDPARARPVQESEQLGMTFNFEYVTETEPLR